jgi:hypothetical protein
MPMPAVTLQSRTVHSSQNDGVRIALAAETLADVTSGLVSRVAGSKPSGFHPSGGTRMVKAPYIMTAK